MLITVDNSKGIKASQVIFILGKTDMNIFHIVISYIDSDNRYSIASFYPRANVGIYKVVMFPFYTRLLEWKNTGI